MFDMHGQARYKGSSGTEEREASQLRNSERRALSIFSTTPAVKDFRSLKPQPAAETPWLRLNSS